jgi:hypothetical protein
MEIRIRNRVRDGNVADCDFGQKKVAGIVNAQTVTAAAVTEEFRVSASIERALRTAEPLEPAFDGKILDLKVGKIIQKDSVPVAIEHECLTYSSSRIGRVSSE